MSYALFIPDVNKAPNAVLLFDGGWRISAHSTGRSRLWLTSRGSDAARNGTVRVKLPFTHVNEYFSFVRHCQNY